MGRDHRRVVTWLWIGVIMVFVQILLGGITRLTGSGLSITKWDIVTGSIPPLNEAQWNQTFELYKETPQYKKINEGITLSRFKFIFFWEYFHRLWARSMGFVFLIPFCFFFIRRSLSKATMRRLSMVIGFAALAAVFGWIMVASGLRDRPWVNAYNLTVHLALGISLLIALFNTWLVERGFSKVSISPGFKKLLNLSFGLVVIQVVLGGMVSGMKSALNYPTWPMMHKEWIPSIILDGSHWNKSNFLLYDQSGFMPALVQFLHRNTAYLIALIIILVWFGWRKKYPANTFWMVNVLLGIIVVQILFGILILINSIGSIPVLYGAFHQGVGILLITFLFYLFRKTAIIPQTN
jgi:cytochrome c oxidase assembly protein subunit 15